MKNLYLILLSPLLTGCLGLEQRFTEARMEWGAALQAQAETQMEANEELEEAVFSSQGRLAAGLITREEHREEIESLVDERDETIGESFDHLKESVEASWETLKEGVEQDVAEVSAATKGAAGGLLGGGPLWDLIAAAGTAVVGANAARNRNLPGTRRIPPAVQPNKNGDGGSQS